MKRKLFTGKLIYHARKNSSYYGNPKFYGEFESETGETFKGTTATDAACAYGFLNSKDRPREIEYHTTRTGNNIIDYIRIK